jgi:hypothetical protein
MKPINFIKRKLKLLIMKIDKLIPANSFDVLDIFGIALVIIAVFALFLYPPIAKQPQKITDLFYDNLWYNSNKSGELLLLTLLTILGIGLIAWFDSKRKPALTSETSSEGLYYAIIALPLMLYYFFWGSFPQFYLILGIIFIGITLVRQQYALKAVFAYAFVYFACMGVFTLIRNDLITDRFVTAVSLFIFALALWGLKANKNILDKVILATQILIPLCLFIFLRNEYVIDGNVVVIPFLRRYVAIVMAAIIGSVVYAVITFILYLRRDKKIEGEDGLPLENLILISTLCVLTAFRADINTSQFVPSDFWHYGERVISWQQVIELGLVPYKEAFAPSGLFSIVNGFFLNTVFDGTASSILPAITFEQVFYAFLIASVLSLATGTALAGLLLYILPITQYERYHLIFLSLAILALPAVWKDINRWLKAWGLLVIVNMLNYPLFGMSLAFGGMPFAVCGIYLAVKQGKLIKWLKRPSFYVLWITVFCAIAPFVPLLYRMITTSAIQGADTVQKDVRTLLTNGLGIPAYAPNRIFQYTVLLNTLSLAVMIPAYILIRILRSSSISWKEKIAHPLFYFSTLGLFFLPAAYSYAVMRMDGAQLNRAAGPVAIVLVLCIIAILKYAHPVFANKEKLSFLVVIFLLAVPFVSRHNSFRYINKIQVPNDYVRISDEDRTRMPRLGNGFIHKDSLNELNRYYDFLEKNELWDNNFHAGNYLPNYILNIGAPGTAALLVAQGYKLSKLYFDAFKDKPFVGKDGGNRYINYWLIFDKGIVQTPEGFWVSPELVEGKYNPEDLKKPVFGAGMDLYSVAYGRSMKSLRPIFENVKLIHDIEEFKLGINGIDADYIYIELETDIKIKNSYFEPWDFTQYGIRFFFKHNGQWDHYDIPYGDGRLLIAIGDDSRWLYEYIEEIAVELDKGFSPDTQSKMKKLELLKLKRYQ